MARGCALIAVAVGCAAIAAGPVSASTVITAPGPNGPLEGTLVSAGSRDARVVLIIPGSGPTDRHGNSPLGIRAAPYRLLAEDLAKAGVTTVRVDKRGMFGSAAAVPDANTVTLGDYVHDTHAWTRAIRDATGARCIWLLGHSEGGLVALAAAVDRSDDVCGLILASTPGRPLAETLKAQLRANPANAPLLVDANRIIDSLGGGLILASTPGRPLAETLKAQLRANPANAPLLVDANRIIDSLGEGRRVPPETIPGPLEPLFHPSVQDFLMSIIAVDPAELLGRMRKPVLILQGDRDLQVDVPDASRLSRADPQARLVVLPGMNHVLKQVDTVDMNANVSSYADPNLPLARGIVDAIVRFVEAGRPR